MDGNSQTDFEEREPLYFISIAARLVGMHVQTLRKYERMGLIEPLRSGGNVRLYSPDDIRRLKQIKNLVGEVGVNLAGIDRILEIAEVVLQLEHLVQDERGEERLHESMLKEISTLKRLLGFT
ncbi:MAG: MerR family transcriptional regulator [Dehalococcoidia bacterium]|nr:MerR family transcriptional regulator [Dehalococcoidia bacterium]